MKNLVLLGLVAVPFVTTAAHAYEFRVRFVERIGDTDTVLEGNTIDARDFAPRRIRVQFGVFDDAESDAPAGGYLGWLPGSITVSGESTNSDETRTDGRIAPFDFAPNGDGQPPSDPFDALVDIDSTLGIQEIPWEKGAPPPPPVIRGLNSFVSTYEFTIDPADDIADSYSIDVAGDLYAASVWLILLDGDPFPGLVYAPVATLPRPFSARLDVVVPSPATAAILGGGGLICFRRRR